MPQHSLGDKLEIGSGIDLLLADNFPLGRNAGQGDWGEKKGVAAAKGAHFAAHSTCRPQVPLPIG